MARQARLGRIAFAPLRGLFARRALGGRELPDSLVVLTDRGQVLHRSRAVAWLARRLGWPWRIGSLIIGMSPRRWWDCAYDAVAARRHALAGSCRLPGFGPKVLLP
jgi:predicted DCC family thiol-disulfide oxidoreductase YuxK